MRVARPACGAGWADQSRACPPATAAAASSATMTMASGTRIGAGCSERAVSSGAGCARRFDTATNHARLGRPWGRPDVNLANFGETLAEEDLGDLAELLGDGRDQQLVLRGAGRRRAHARVLQPASNHLSGGPGGIDDPEGA